MTRPPDIANPPSPSPLPDGMGPTFNDHPSAGVLGFPLLSKSVTIMVETSTFHDATAKPGSKSEILKLEFVSPVPAAVSRKRLLRTEAMPLFEAITVPSLRFVVPSENVNVCAPVMGYRPASALRVESRAAASRSTRERTAEGAPVFIGEFRGVWEVRPRRGFHGKPVALPKKAPNPLRHKGKQRFRL